MCWWKVSFLLRMNSKYFYESLGWRVGPPMVERSSGGGLKNPCDLLKWNISVFECSMIKPNSSRSLVNTL